MNESTARRKLEAGRRALSRAHFYFLEVAEGLDNGDVEQLAIDTERLASRVPTDSEPLPKRGDYD